MSESNWSKIVAALRGGSSGNYKLSDLVSLSSKRKARPSERDVPRDVLMSRCELLYRMEPLIFSSVNKLTRRITQPRIYFSGENAEENEKAMQFATSSRLLALLPHLVRDALIYGFGVAEKVKVGNSIILSQIDPKEFDYIRVNGNEIKLNSNGEIAGYVWKRMSEERTFKPNEVVIIRFFTLGEYCLGISPIETAFKAAWVKLNLEEALGEAIFRHGFPLVKYKVGTPTPGPWHEITPQKIKEAKKVLQNLEAGGELILPWWIDAEILTGRGDLGNVHQFLLTLSMEILAAFEQPKTFAISTRSPGGRDAEELDFEKAVIAFQNELRRQLEEQLLNEFYTKNKFRTSPQMMFTEYAPEIENIKLRRLSAFAKHGLITRTEALENALLRAEGLPEKKKKVPGENNLCIFELGHCPVRAEEDMPLDKLSSFCNICVKRLNAQKKLES